MKMKSMIAIALCLGFVSMSLSVIATDSIPIVASGAGTATVTNIAPSVDSTAVNDGGGWVTSLDVLTEYYFYVNVTDNNLLDDMKSVTMEFRLAGKETADDPIHRYKFRYTETTPNNGTFGGVWEQIMPTAGSYLNIAACTTPALTTDTSGFYVFAVSLYTIAEAGNTWFYNATITDNASAKTTVAAETYTVYKYIEMSYDSDGVGGVNFAWAGSPGDVNVSDSFDVDVTSNAPYFLAAAYQDRFYNATNDWKWSNEPSLEVNTETLPKYALTNETVEYQDWWNTTSVPALNQITTHTIYLDFESVLPLLTYTGVTIYIQARV